MKEEFERILMLKIALEQKVDSVTYRSMNLLRDVLKIAELPVSVDLLGSVNIFDNNDDNDFKITVYLSLDGDINENDNLNRTRIFLKDVFVKRDEPFWPSTSEMSGTEAIESIKYYIDGDVCERLLHYSELDNEALWLMLKLR
jgi:hypothetical protein